MDNTIITDAPPTLINNNNISHEQELVGDIDDLMLSNLFMDQQNNYEPSPPPFQQQDGDQDQLPPNFASFLHQVEVPDPSADQVPNLDSYHVEDNAANEQSWNQQQQQEGGDQQVVNPEFDGNVFDSEDYSILFDPEHPFQDCDDDFLNAILDADM
ncbi:PREDICTED: uncharacterized protein LOC103333256 [Prunus mume]|uniref:Uncharacterized protein LOC103333256 n=1 Tax=Prunus mume TaxID=102107 RepID=A0ABM0P4J9_PRUMU|nr:PREDICTED: uncharacterized protein LOC103333256 [Prunus mume]